MHAAVRIAALAVALCGAGGAFAQTYPARPINMIVPFPPGGNTDIMARALQNEISKALGKSVIVIDKGGASGTLGIIELNKAEPDGYTVALTPNNPITAQPFLLKLPYAMDSFRYICLSYYSPYVLMAGPQAPFKTFEEFVQFAKAKPQNLVYGHPGVASQPHLGMLSVLKAIGADGLGVPFQGAGPMSQALLSGTVMAITETPAVAAASNFERARRAGGSALRRPSGRAQHAGIRLSGDRFHGRRPDRAGRDPAGGRRDAGEGLRPGHRDAGIQNHRREDECRGPLSRRHRVPQTIRRRRPAKTPTPSNAPVWERTSSPEQALESAA
jgi:hypothetical protein